MKKLITIASLLICLTAQAQDGKKCKALTRAGKPCRNEAIINGYCGVHNPSAPRCGVLKSDGTPCKMRVEKAGDKCHFHKK